MSSYSSLFRVLSPSRVQTKFEENTKSYTTDIMAFCFVVGTSIESAFEVIGQAGMSISALRDIIYDKNKNYFEEIKVDANKLHLWKVDIPGDVENVKLKKLERRSHDINDENTTIQELEGKKLIPFEDFGDIFTYSSSKNIRIIAQPPPPATTGKRKMVEDEDDNIAKKRRHKDKGKFQDLINSLPDINIKDKVFKIPSLPGDKEDMNIYNRECYKYLSNFILNDTKFSRYLITGNPGIGKTFFGKLMLIMLLKKNKKVLLDCEAVTALIHPSGEIEHVSDKLQYRQIAEEQDVWCIIDGKRDQLGHDFSNGKLIMVSSPKKSIIGDFAKQWCLKLYMPIWNEFEIEDCRRNVYHEKISSELLNDKFKLCGGIPRLIFGESLLDIKSAIKQALTSVEPSMLCDQAKDFSGDEYTHKLIHVHTNLEETEVEGEKADPYTGSSCFFGTDYIASKCLKRLKEKYKEDLRTFIETARDIPEMGSLRGQLFELVSHEILCQGGTFPVHKLTDDGKLEPETTLTLGSLEDNFFNNISEIEGQDQDKYYRPTSKIFESIDSYVCVNKLFQVTVAKSHGIKQEGLRAIKGILDPSCRINFYFVLPKDVFTTFTKEQKYQNTGKGIIIDEWITENIDQYALCIDLDQYSF